jgi:hypothetical protein
LEILEIELWRLTNSVSLRSKTNFPKSLPNYHTIIDYQL